MKLTTCNNCGHVYEDMNPGDESIEYDDNQPELQDLDELPIIEHELEEGEAEPYIGYGCEHCKTDGYLVDNINENAGGMAAALHSQINPLN